MAAISIAIFLLPTPAKSQHSDATVSTSSKTQTQTADTPFTTFTSTHTLTASSQTPITPSPTTSSTATEQPPVLTATLEATPFPTEDLPPGDYLNNEVLVKLKTRKPSENFLGMLQNLNAEIKMELSDLGIFLIEVPTDGVPFFIANIKQSQDVVYAEPNYIMSITDTIPNDGSWGLQYAPAAIRAPQGWDLSTGSSAVTIAIIDTGLDQSHPDLAAKIVPGYDFVNNDSDPQDDNGHGSHVAGIAAASSNNGQGIAGISWGARLMPVKVLNAIGNGSYANAAAGIVWAADNGAQVINLSFGGASPSSTLNDAIVYAYSKGATIVGAAGNSGSNLVLYPAHYPEVIAVAATDGSNSRAGFSNYGPEMSVSAPGVSIYSSLTGGAYGYKSGTSMSAPMVSGAAAVLAGLPGNDNPATIAWELQSSALDLGAPGFDVFYGYGLIQLDAAIQLAMPITPTPTLTPTPTETPTLTATLTTMAALTPTSSLTATVPPTASFTPIIKITATITPITSASPNATLTMGIIRTTTATPFDNNHKTPTPQPWVIFPPVFFPQTTTPTSTVTSTIIISATTRVDVTSTRSPTPTIHPIQNNNTEIQAQASATDDLLLPCSGILFILAGLLLAYIALQRKQP